MGFPINYPIHSLTGAQELETPADQKQLVPSRNQIADKRYATSVDDRHFITVYEYSINNQWVMWDYFTGYVHLTGLWKAIGNNKADIVRLVDNCPELEPDLRRVRGGYLKIQGTWVPFDVGKRLASRTCWNIRYALVPIFGTDFPESCLKPHEPGFGRLEMTLSVRRRRRRSTKQLQQQQAQQQIQQQIQPQNQQQNQLQVDQINHAVQQRGLQHHQYMDRQYLSHQPQLQQEQQFKPRGFSDGMFSLSGQLPLASKPPSHSASYGSSSGFASWSLQHQPAPSYNSISTPLDSKGQQKLVFQTSSKHSRGVRKLSQSEQPRSNAHKHKHSMSMDVAVPLPRSNSGSSSRSRSNYGSGFSSGYHLPDYLENAIDSSPEDYDDDDDDDDLSPTPSTTPLATPTATSPNYTTAPVEPDPLPNVLPCTPSSPQDLLELLQATRSLQQISAGSHGSSWSSNRRSFGGGFECAGKLWQWDGNQHLAIVGTSPGPEGPEESTSPTSHKGGKLRAPSLSSAITPRVLPWSPPVSPEKHEPGQPDDTPSRTAARYASPSMTTSSSSSSSSSPSETPRRGFYMNIHSILS